MAEKIEVKKKAPAKAKAKIVAVKKAKPAVKARKVVASVDMTEADVLKLQAEGHQIYFDDSDEGFLELSSETFKELKAEFKQRYSLAKAIVSGEDVIGAAMDGQRGFSNDYNVRPGSAGENLAVYGKDPTRDYYWARPDKVNKHKANGYEADNDPDVKTRYDDAGTLKTVGGQNKPEAVLMSRPKRVGKELKRRRKEIRQGRLKRSSDSMRETVERMGAKVI